MNHHVDIIIISFVDYGCPPITLLAHLPLVSGLCSAATLCAGGVDSRKLLGGSKKVSLVDLALSYKIGC